MSELTRTQIQSLRMRALALTGPAESSPGGARTARPTVASIVQWFGAMQAQDLASGLWSFGARIAGTVESDITDALERKEALRTWPMRGTVHFVPPRDAKWMVDLMGVKPLAGAAKRREFLGMTEATTELAVDTLRIVLAGGKRLSRAQCLEALADAGIETASQVGYHLLWYASQKGVTCVAPHVGKDQTFVLLDEYVPDPHLPERDEALAIMALRYVRGHGPVTDKEMARWTGLGVRDCRTGIALARSDGTLTEVQTELGPMLVTAELAESAGGTGTPADRAEYLVLPGFDEYMLGYGDRSLMLDPEGFQHVVPGNNGVFRSTLVRDGRVLGTWKRTLRAKSCLIDAVPLGLGARGKITASDRAAFEAAFKPYGAFVGKPAEVVWA